MLVVARLGIWVVIGEGKGTAAGAGVGAGEHQVVARHVFFLFF